MTSQIMRYLMLEYMREERCVVKVSCGAAVGPSSFSLTQWLVWWPMSSASSRGSTWLMGTTSHQPTLCCVWGLNWCELTSNSWISPRPEFCLNSKVTWNASALTEPSFPLLSPLQPGQRSGEERPQLLDGDAPSENVSTSEKCNVYFQCVFLVMNSACLWGYPCLSIVSHCSRGAAQMEDSWKQRGPRRSGLHTFGQGQESG